MEFFGSFRHRASSATRPAASGTADSFRFRGYRGGVIPMHRALTHFRLGFMNLVTAVFLCVFFSGLWLACLGWMCEFWKRILAIGIRLLPLHAELAVADHRWTPYLRAPIPYPRIESVLPTAETWGLACGVTVLLLAASFFLPKKLIPAVYLLRGVLLVQGSALFYFAVMPARFPHTPDSYMQGLVSSGMGLISIVPLLFALTYYIFDFGLLKKAFLTATTMAHLALFLPLQVLLQALVLQKTILFMPVLYLIFGMPVEVLFIVAFYAWGMSWLFRTTNGE